MTGNVPINEIADAIVGLSPIPDSNILSFTEYIKSHEMIEENMVAIGPDKITFGAYNEAL
jgi:Eukaryotic aspartyl protease